MRRTEIIDRYDATILPSYANPNPDGIFGKDNEYERNGTANLFMLFAPLEGWRHVKVTDHDARARSGDITVR